MRVGGIVLCGGRSSRMGRPKAWLPFGEELLLQRVVRVVGEAVGPVVVVAAPGQDVPPLPGGVEVVRDEEEGRGPLAGLVAGLAALEGRADAAYLSACDAPFLTAAFVRRVVESLEDPTSGPPPPRGEGGPEGMGLGSCSPSPRGGGEGKGRGTDRGEGSVLIAVPRLAGHAHPLAAAYRLDVLPLARQLLAAGRGPLALLDLAPALLIEPHDLPDLTSLRNLNTPEEYALALEELAGGPATMPI